MALIKFRMMIFFCIFFSFLSGRKFHTAFNELIIIIVMFQGYRIPSTGIVNKCQNLEITEEIKASVTDIIKHIVNKNWAFIV